MCIFISVILEASRVLPSCEQHVFLHPSTLRIIHVDSVFNFLHVRVRMNIFEVLILGWREIQIDQIFVQSLFHQVQIDRHRTLRSLRVVLVVEFVQKHLLVKNNTYFRLYYKCDIRLSDD